MTQNTEYRVVARGVGEPNFSGNGLTYDDPDTAWAAAADLFSRWFGCDAVAVLPLTLDPEAEGRFTLDQVKENNYLARGI